MMQKKIFIILVTYNNSRVITNCLEALNQQTFTNFHLLIIDNNSIDKTIEIINHYCKKHPSLSKKITLLKNNTNLGFAKAVNIGIKKALEQKNIYAVLLLNPDVSFTTDLLHNGVATLNDNPSAGAVVPKILYSDKRIWWVGTRILSNKELLFSPTYGIAEHKNKGMAWQSSKYQTTEVDAITGCALFVRINAVNDVGLLDEKYFMYAEDIDYSNRLKKHGYKLLLFTTSTVFHAVRDRKMNMKIVFASLKKYKIYLKSVVIYVFNNKPFFIFLVWLLKLPYALVFSYVKRKNV